MLRYLLVAARYRTLSGFMQSAMSSSATASGGGKRQSLPDGVWPTMITPFLNDPQKSVDWRSLDCV